MTVQYLNLVCFSRILYFNFILAIQIRILEYIYDLLSKGLKNRNIERGATEPTIADGIVCSTAQEAGG